MDIKKVVSEHGFTMKQIADELGITQQAVSQALNGNPSLSRLQDIARVVGVTVSELVKDENEPAPTPHIICPKCGEIIPIETVVVPKQEG